MCLELHRPKRKNRKEKHLMALAHGRRQVHLENGRHYFIPSPTLDIIETFKGLVQLIVPFSFCLFFFPICKRYFGTAQVLMCLTHIVSLMSAAL